MRRRPVSSQEARTEAEAITTGGPSAGSTRPSTHQERKLSARSAAIVAVGAASVAMARSGKASETRISWTRLHITPSSAISASTPVIMR
jgi:hypothetical protein